jgi:threonine dehydratase
MNKYTPIESPDETTVFPYHDLEPPTTEDVLVARRVVSQFLPETPLVQSEYLSAEFDGDVYLKREDTLPTGAFKVRGGVNLCAGLAKEFRDPGLIAASTGNHGQSIAWAGREFAIPVVIVVPEEPNPEKVAAMRQLGAEVHEYGRDYDEARELAETWAEERGYRYVHSANESALIAGVGTAGLEVLDSLSSVGTVICPIGGGSSASGYCLTAGSIGDADVIGVQSENAPAMYEAWSSGSLNPQEQADTVAEGLQSRVPFALTSDILRDALSDMILVSDDRIMDAVSTMIAEENIIMEGASAAAIAALSAIQEDIVGQTVVVQVSGRNLAGSKLRERSEVADLE